MKVNFPERGELLYAGGATEPTRIISAPLHATFPLTNGQPCIVGQPYELSDDAGTTLTYKLTGVYIRADAYAAGEGELIAVTHHPRNVIPLSDHDQKISTAIDVAFQAGRDVEAQEQAEAAAEQADSAFEWLGAPAAVYVRFSDGSVMMHHDVAAIADQDGVLVLETVQGNLIGVHPSWRSYEIEEVAEQVTDEATAQVLDQMAMSECGCKDCENRKEDDSDFPDRIFRYGPVGGKI